MSGDLTAGIDRAYEERTDFLVVALTGRTGSGCTTTANTLCKPYAEIAFSVDEQIEPEKRKIRIADDLLKKQWIPFKKITASTVIFSFLLDHDEEKITHFLTSSGIEEGVAIDLSSKIELIKRAQKFKAYQKCIHENEYSKNPDGWDFFEGMLSPLADEARHTLGTSYAPLFQSMGDNIRSSGSVISKSTDPSKIFSLIRRVKILAKAAFYSNQSRGKKSTRVVIDAIRNPFELVYLRDQFAAFFAIAITADDGQRRARLEQIGLEKRDIESLDKKEYEAGKSLKTYANLVSQNIQECIQKSDIFLTNPGNPEDFAVSIRKLNAQIVRYVALMLRPGLITPTRDERCMQLAFAAKLNSGCISRQVGAAVADANYSVKSIGWNDVPAGQVPCLLRDADQLVRGGDASAFSSYENTEAKFKAQIDKHYKTRNESLKKLGMPCPFCFKDAYNTITDTENQVHTRALHAEENAFLQLAKHGSSGINGGVLYTTASPCELCSKKAFQLGITEVIYVDPYPGISLTHVLRSGSEDKRPSLRLFSGSVGHAYHRLYEAILPVKDEYNARLKDTPTSPQQPLIS
ncbi:hypothetical protein [Pseudoxanthomonas sp. 10H]|uniref:hypothetical protein n=1 Tax=Pseudoxanthomonas sp. 10H TaxID=3242729 RepID=UPI003555E372